MHKRHSSVFLVLARWLGLVFNLRGMIALYRLPNYFVQWLRFAGSSKLAAPLLDGYPCLSDAMPHTAFDAHYLFQAAWVARRLADARPVSHTDIGSDVGFVATVSAFVPVVFLDFRPLAVRLSGLSSKAGDLRRLQIESGSVESLSCLHVLEHVGLGRYGDSIDPDGHLRAAAELMRVLAPGGRLYVSVPVGRERVCFNAHRVFSTQTILSMFEELQLRAFAYVDDAGTLRDSEITDPANACEYGCGLFCFQKS